LHTGTISAADTYLLIHLTYTLLSCSNPFPLPHNRVFIKGFCDTGLVGGVGWVALSDSSVLLEQNPDA
jgi:hypothetical protein